MINVIPEAFFGMTDKITQRYALFLRLQATAI